jgi:hypothetical protein
VIVLAFLGVIDLMLFRRRGDKKEMFSMARVWLACTYSLVLALVVILGGCDSRGDAQKRLEAYQAERKNMDELDRKMRESMDRPTLQDLAKAMEQNERYREMIRQKEEQRPQAFQTPTASQLPVGWHDDLRRQVRVDEACDTQSVWNVWRRSGQDSVLVAVRVQCVDGRRFIATRPALSELFVFERCDAPGTQACPN